MLREYSSSATVSLSSDYFYSSLLLQSSKTYADIIHKYLFIITYWCNEDFGE